MERSPAAASRAALRRGGATRVTARPSSVTTRTSAPSGTSRRDRRWYSASVARKRARSRSLWTAAARKSTERPAVRAVSITGSIGLRATWSGREEEAAGEARLGDLAHDRTGHGVVDGNGRRQGGRHDQERMFVRGHEDALHPGIGRGPVDEPAGDAAHPPPARLLQLLPDEARQGIRHGNALHPPVRGEIEHPDLGAGFLVRVGPALLH